MRQVTREVELGAAWAAATVLQPTAATSRWAKPEASLPPGRVPSAEEELEPPVAWEAEGLQAKGAGDRRREGHQQGLGAASREDQLEGSETAPASE